MGKNNRARRAAKAKARHRRNEGPSRSTSSRAGGDDDGMRAFTNRELVEMLWSGVAMATAKSEPHDDFLLGLSRHNDLLVDREAERSLSLGVGFAWAGGWQPAELVRQAKRGTTSRVAARLIEFAVAVDHLAYADHELDPRWSAQLDDLDLPTVTGGSGWSTPLLAELGDRADQLAAVADAIGCLGRLRRLDVLIPPPGADAGSTWLPDGGYTAAASDDDPVIAKVRNLLAKAESTEFEAEAMAFTAKAHELMTRHAIDRAMVAAGGTRDERDRPVAARVFVDAPYADAKSLLLQIIADESRCRCAFLTGYDMSTVVGFADDIAAVQLLFTSLLIQAQSALNVAARSAPPGTRTRSQSFRSAFYVAYANRIGERLEEANRHTTSEATAELGGGFLPVLADRQRDVDDVFDERFNNLTEGRIRGGWDSAGAASGRHAADQATLQFADLTEGAEPVDLTDPPVQTALDLGEPAALPSTQN